MERHISTTSSQGSMPSSRRVRTNCKIMRFNKTPERKRKTSRDIQTFTGKRDSHENDSNFKFEQASRFAPEITHRNRIFSADDMGLRQEPDYRRNEPCEETKEAPVQQVKKRITAGLPGMPAFKKPLPFANLAPEKFDKPSLPTLSEESLPSNLV